MQSSSAARLFGASVIAALALAYLPVPIAPDLTAQAGSLAQATLPAPVFTTLRTATNVEASAQTRGSSVSGSLTGRVSPSTGTRLVIPSINVNDPIVPVGLTSGGAMAVPSGKSNQVGWYDGGPKPGQIGSAVLDAHVFAAFSKLNRLKVGDSIYVDENGQQLRFVVTAVKTYALSQITSQDLFTPTNSRDLNLITCAGKLIDHNTTYDHRLVVYATLAD